MVKSTDSGANCLVQLCMCWLRDLGHTNHLTFLDLSFLISKMGTLVAVYNRAAVRLICKA